MSKAINVFEEADDFGPLHKLSQKQIATEYLTYRENNTQQQLHDMGIHETMGDDTLRVVRVTNGWIYSDTGAPSVNSVFVAQCAHVRKRQLQMSLHGQNIFKCPTCKCVILEKF